MTRRPYRISKIVKIHVCIKFHRSHYINSVDIFHGYRVIIFVFSIFLACNSFLNVHQFNCGWSLFAVLLCLTYSCLSWLFISLQQSKNHRVTLENYEPIKFEKENFGDSKMALHNDCNNTWYASLQAVHNVVVANIVCRFQG